MEIIAREDGKSLLISFPYDLKEAFKTIFKTAKWDSGKKRWVVSNSTVNHNKLKLFIDKSQAALAALKEIEEQEATDIELATLEYQLKEIESKTREALDSKVAHQSQIAKIADIKSKLELRNPELIKAQNEAAETKAALNKTIEDQVKKYNIDTLVGRLIYVRKQYTLSENRKKFGSLQGELIRAHEQILSTTGINLKALRELYDEDYRKTSAQDLYYIARDLHTNYDIVDPTLADSIE